MKQVRSQPMTLCSTIAAPTGLALTSMAGDLSAHTIDSFVIFIVAYSIVETLSFTPSNSDPRHLE